MPRIEIENMSPGQLKLEFASTCRFHQVDGVAALGYASRVPVDVLRSSLIDYRTAAEVEDWGAAENALIGVVEWTKPHTD